MCQPSTGCQIELLSHSQSSLGGRTLGNMLQVRSFQKVLVTALQLLAIQQR